MRATSLKRGVNEMGPSFGVGLPFQGEKYAGPGPGALPLASLVQAFGLGSSVAIHDGFVARASSGNG